MKQVTAEATDYVALMIRRSKVALVKVPSDPLSHIASNAQTRSCGPDFCTDSLDFKKALAAKKSRLSKDYPVRLVGLLDKVDRCKARIERTLDGFSLLRRTPDGKITVDSWTRENEKLGAVAPSSGALTACCVINTRHAIECCGTANFSNRADYDQQLDLNTGTTVECEK